MHKIPRYKIFLAVADYLAFLLTFMLAFSIAGDPLSGLPSVSFLPAYKESLFIVVFSAGMILVFQSLDLYKLNIFLTRVRHLIQVLMAMAYGILIIAITNFFFQASFSIPSRSIAVLFGIIGALVFTCYRIIVFRSAYKYLNKKNITYRNTIIIGADTPSKQVVIRCETDEYYGLRIIGFVDPHIPKGQKVYKQYMCIGKPDELPDLVKEYNVAEIFIAASNFAIDELLSIIDMCKSTKTIIRVSSDLFDIVHMKVPCETIMSIPTVRLTSMGEQDWMHAWKRMFGLVGSLIGLLILSVPMLIIGILIKRSSPGPVIFKQVRIGRNGVPFNFYKFRSMTINNGNDADRAAKYKEYIKQDNRGQTPLSKIVDEARVTKIGKFLRKTSLDELPQLVNVLKGDMCLVGPRPCLPYEYEAYEEWHKRRLSVHPGCTGLWQVTNRAEGSFNDMVLLDLYYIDNMTPWFDLQIIFKTIPVMMFGWGGK